MENFDSWLCVPGGNDGAGGEAGEGAHGDGVLLAGGGEQLEAEVVRGLASVAAQYRTVRAVVWGGI